MRESVYEREHPMGDGIQKIYKFDNGFGASVVKNRFSYGGYKGLWELAVVIFPNSDLSSWDITYDTPIAKDVLGWLTESEVDEILSKIESLPMLV